MDMDCPRELTVSQTSQLIGKSGGGIRGAISRGLLRSSLKDGKNILMTHDLGSYLVYGFAYPEEKMSVGQKDVLHAMFWTLYGDRGTTSK